MIGVYKIENIKTGMLYIGSSIDIDRRWKDHRSQLNRGVHHCKALQEAWAQDGSGAFKHAIIKVCSLDDLEARESQLIEEAIENSVAYNTSATGYNPMRDPEVVAKGLATRGDKQHGAGSSSAKLTEEQYLQIVVALASTTYSAEDLSDYFGLSPRSIRDIQNGKKHKWIKERFPQEFEKMFNWRKNLRAFRSMGSTPPGCNLPVDCAFLEELQSFRRSYAWREDQEQQLDSVNAQIEALLSDKEKVDLRKDHDRLAKEKNKLEKEKEKLQRKVEEDKKPWLELVHSDGHEKVFYNQEEVGAAGLQMKFIAQLRAGKLIRYKGYRIKK